LALFIINAVDVVFYLNFAAIR